MDFKLQLFEVGCIQLQWLRPDLFRNPGLVASVIDINKQNQRVLVGFRSAYVFDVSQTEGAPPPDLLERVKGEVGEYRERLVDFLMAQGIELEFKESIAPALGMSYGGRIAILPRTGRSRRVQHPCP